MSLSSLAETASSLILNPPLWVFWLIAALVTLTRLRHLPSLAQGVVILIGLLLMAIPHNDLWSFGIWVCAAYLADMVGDDAAPGTFLVISALFYPATALGFNPWWCQFWANISGLLALGAISGMGGGILANLRYRQPSGTDFMGVNWFRSNP